MIGRWIVEIGVKYRRIMNISLLMILLIGIGTVGFMHFESLGLFDALWLMIISIMTIGYGDIYPVTEHGQIFTLFIVPAGIVVFSYGFGSAATYFLERYFPEKVREKRMEIKMKKLRNHIIICGTGGFAKQVYDEICLSQNDADIVFISEDKKFMEDNLKPETIRIVDDPTERRVLEQARAPYAKALFAAMQEDADNVFITLTVKNLNEDIQVAARANKAGSEAILEKAGAEHVINPYVIGGRELAMSILQPSDVSRIQELRSSESTDFSVKEVKIDTDSPLFQKSLHQLKLYEKFGVLPAGISRNGQLIRDPSQSEQLQDQDVLLILGRHEQIEAIKRSK